MDQKKALIAAHAHAHFDAGRYRAADACLRGVQAASGLRAAFDPPVGFAAGATIAARLTHREWLSTMVLGWYFGGVYWRALGVTAPPGSRGVPITVRGIQF